jgi:hypothetical protein
MADVSVNVITPAESYALISLEELKIALGIAAADTANDAQLEWLIDTNSSMISTWCNRVFAKEEVVETWRDTVGRRVHLTHWPVKAADITSVTTDGDVRLDYELEEDTGKLSIFTARDEPIIISYTGGYLLPDEAPMALKQAAALLVSTSRTEQAAASLTGVRMISHKDSRVMFHSPTSGGGNGSSASSAQTQARVESLLSRYVHHWS